MAKPSTVTDASFEQDVLRSAQPVLVDFWADWCQPCKRIAPILEELADEQAERLKIAKLDVDQYPDTAQRYGVMSIPTLLLFKNGQPVERLVGYMPKDQLVRRLSPHLS